VGQIVEIPFWRTGWIYLGELGNRRGINYSSRRLDIEAGLTIGQTFLFTADETGTYILRFFRQDFVQDYLLHDFVQVIVGERREDTGRVGIPARDRIIAEPRWPVEQVPAPPPVVEYDPPLAPVIAPVSGFPPAADETPHSLVEIGEESTPVERSALIPPPPPRFESPAEIVQRARREFDAGNIEQAIAILNNMRQLFPDGTDEFFWLYAQLLEANSPFRDVRLALDYYRHLVTTFPQSARVPDAQRRIAYLERFFFNIR